MVPLSVTGLSPAFFMHIFIIYLHLHLRHEIFYYYVLTCGRLTQIFQVLVNAVVEHVNSFFNIHQCDHFHGVVAIRKVDWTIMMLFLDHYGSNCQSSEEAREGLEQMTMKLWNWTYWLRVTTRETAQFPWRQPLRLCSWQQPVTFCCCYFC
jgi:hypothetical protein